MHFPCECVSSRRGGYSEPWAAVAKNKLLPDGTKEEILNLVARQPRTISQLAAALGLSAPTVHTHAADILKSELLRDAVEWVFWAEQPEANGSGRGVERPTGTRGIKGPDK